jgi:hypothetical protein
MTPKLLPPTVTAIATLIAGICAAIAGVPAVAASLYHLPNPLVTLFGPQIGPMISAAAAVVSIVGTYIAGAGRSFVKSVDNPGSSGPQKP